MPEPLRKYFSRDELIRFAMDWMKNKSGYSIAENEEVYHARMGMLINFVTDIAPDDNQNKNTTP
jgi:hypothetical protein